MYRGRRWTMRQYSGLGTAAQTNERYRFLLAQGATGLSVALDLPTQIGYDSDDPDVEEEVGRVGVAIDTLADMEAIFDGIPLGEVSTSFTINGTAAILLAMYVAVAEKQGVPADQIRGTIQNDILKEYVSRGTWIFPPEPSLRLIVDTIEFCLERAPRFNPISVAGAHFRDAGATAVQELAFTLADAITYVERCRARGLSVDEVGRQLSFFFYTHTDFFEEVAKYRAGRRLWARIMRDRFGATSDRACMFRVGCVCGGASLTAEQPLNNVVRVAYQALAATLGGVQSMFTCAWDEALTIPSEETAELALRTQQVLAEETGDRSRRRPPRRIALRGGADRPLRGRGGARSSPRSRSSAAWCRASRTGRSSSGSPTAPTRTSDGSRAATASSSASTSTAARSPHRASSSTRSTRTSWPRRSSASGGCAASGIRNTPRARWHGCGRPQRAPRT